MRYLSDMARASIDAGRLDSAASIYEQLVRMAPADPGVRHTLGLVYFEQGLTDKALYQIGRSIELDASNAVAYRSMADALNASREFPLAIRAYEKAYALDPQNTDALLNMGSVFHALDMLDRARDTFLKIISQAPDHRQTLNNLGKVYHDAGQLRSALACYDRCLALNPDYAEARFNRAALLLALGDFDRGWQEYEWRFKRSGAAKVYPHRLHMPRWRGESYRGRRLLVHCEQGMGDVLQFVRYLPSVKERGGQLILEAHAPLVPLLETLPWIDELISFNEKRPPDTPYDLQTPLLSLPGIFDTRPDTIPEKIPYIQIDPEAGNTWKNHLKADGVNIGLVWTSSDLNPKRNLPIHKCTSWFQDPGLKFIGLQKGSGSGQLLSQKTNTSSITELGPLLNNFHDTAAAMLNLDLVISVDTAAAHLAGALGKRLWLLLPYSADWRWPLDGGDSPWYPGVKIFRQSRAGDWDMVIHLVAEELQKLSAAFQINTLTPG